MMKNEKFFILLLKHVIDSLEMLNVSSDWL